MTGGSGDLTRFARDGSAGAPFAREGATTRRYVARVVLVVFAVATSACTPYKARDRDPNEGGGSSMVRAIDFAGEYR